MLLMAVEVVVGKEVLDLVDFQAVGNLDNLDKPHRQLVERSS